VEKIADGLPQTGEIKRAVDVAQRYLDKHEDGR
jgi:hypothetical protein